MPTSGAVPASFERQALAAWVVVRGWFAYTEASKGRSLLELIRDIRGAVKGEG